MRSLVVGGTGFLGGAITAAAVASGHDVTVLSRGIKDSELPTGVQTIATDRYGAMDALDNEDFDLVFDTCAFEPKAVERLLEKVGSDLTRYVFVSSCSVYGDRAYPGADESLDVETASSEDIAVAMAVPPEDRAKAAAYGAAYGPLKRACEVIADRMLGERVISLRAGLLVGAGDYTDRLTWWVRRLDQGGRMPVPGPKNRPVQVIDVCDAAAFAVHAAISKQSGVFNLTGEQIEMSDLLNCIVESCSSDTEMVWIDEERFFELGINPWTDLPMVVPPVGGFRHFLELSTQRAIHSGLRCRPLHETIEGILVWDRGRRDHSLICGLRREQEELVLSRMA